MGLVKLISKVHDFVLVFSEQCIPLILINLWTILDFLGSMCVSDCAYSLGVVVRTRTYRGDHERFCVTTQ